MLDPPSPDASSADVTIATESFSQLGDLDGDGIICSPDLDAMETLAALAPTLGMESYTARGDMDLDGDVDGDDLTIFLDLFASLPDCNENSIPDECEAWWGCGLPTERHPGPV